MSEALPAQNDLRAFHNDPDIKNLFVERVRTHRLLDEVARCGAYYTIDLTTGRRQMCAVGCTVHSGDYTAYERELGIPCHLAAAEDSLFEGMAEDDAMNWPERFLSTIPVGADLTGVAARLMLWLVDEDGYNVGRWCNAEDGRYIRRVAALYRRSLSGAPVTRQECEDAFRNALDAAALRGRGLETGLDGMLATTKSAQCALLTAGWAALFAAHCEATVSIGWTLDRAAMSFAYPESVVHEALIHAVVGSMYQESADDARERAYGRIAEHLLKLLATAPVPALRGARGDMSDRQIERDLVGSAR